MKFLKIKYYCIEIFIKQEKFIHINSIKREMKYNLDIYSMLKGHF